MDTRRAIAAGVLLSVLVGPASAAAAPPTTQPDGLSDARLKGLVAQLAHRSYRVRESASRGLAQLDFRQIERLVPLFKSSASPEQRLRLRAVAERIFIAAKLAGGPPDGFLGVTHVVQQPGVAGASVSVFVEGVLANTPAQRAGLRPGDVINAIEGKAIFKQEAGGFAEQIRRMRPGHKIRLTVVRGEETVTLAAVLGDRSRFNVPTGDRDWINQFNQFWRERFDPSDTTVDVGRGIMIKGGMIIIQNGGQVIFER